MFDKNYLFLRKLFSRSFRGKCTVKIYIYTIMIANLSKNSILFISLFENFIKKKCSLKEEKINENTKNILANLFKDIEKGEKYTKSVIFHKVVYPISSINEIPKPKTFSTNSFPSSIIQHINSKALYCVTYDFSLNMRQIKVNFVIEEKTSSFNKYDDYIKRIILLLCLLDKNSQSRCAKKMTIYIYLTLKQKILPQNNLYILNQNNVNSAFTYSCPNNSEVIIFRKEEWFKTLTHELFHTMGMDFSLIHQPTSTFNNILKLFPIPIKELHISESYSECWARIINILFCSYYISSLDTSPPLFETFLYNFETLIQIEKIYSCFQMVKILDFMGLDYTDLYSSSLKSKIARENLYKENTNVFCYYILTYILLENYQDFLFFCKNNNNHFFLLNDDLRRKKNMENFYNLIKDNYKRKKTIISINCMKYFIYENKNIYNNKKNTKYTKDKNMNYLLNNTRMTICEIK